jgi:hypothetical protein
MINKLVTGKHVDFRSMSFYKKKKKNCTRSVIKQRISYYLKIIVVCVGWEGRGWKHISRIS